MCCFYTRLPSSFIMWLAEAGSSSSFSNLNTLYVVLLEGTANSMCYREQIDKRVREELGPYIIPSTLPWLPNFFVKEKGPDGSTAVAEPQACYDGALGACGIYKLQSFGTDAATTYDNNAYTITSTYHGGTLKMYTHQTRPGYEHRRPPPQVCTLTQSPAWTHTHSPDPRTHDPGLDFYSGFGLSYGLGSIPYFDSVYGLGALVSRALLRSRPGSQVWTEDCEVSKLGPLLLLPTTISGRNWLRST